MTEIKAFLQRIEMFIGLSDKMLDEVAALCRKETFSAGSLIIKHNSPPDDFYLIQDGSVDIITAPNADQRASEQSVVVSLGNGQSFGEMGLVDSGTRSATVRATTDTKTLVINCEQFTALCEVDTDLGYQVMKNIAIDLSFKLRYRNLI